MMHFIVQDHWNIFHLSFDEKNGEEEIKYDLDACEVFRRNLRNYGLPRAGDALSQSQVYKVGSRRLNKAMGKKQKEVLDKMKPKFVEQAAAKT
jgi:DNA polymerase-3 subunit alpha